MNYFVFYFAQWSDCKAHTKSSGNIDAIDCCGCAQTGLQKNNNNKVPLCIEVHKFRDTFVVATKHVVHFVFHSHLHDSLAGMVHGVVLVRAASMLTSDRHSLTHESIHTALLFVFIVAEELLDGIDSRSLSDLLRRSFLALLHLLECAQQLVVIKIILDLALLVLSVQHAGNLRENARVRARSITILDVVTRGVAGGMIRVEAKVLDTLSALL